MNRARLQQQRDWLQQRVNAGGRSFSPWDALELYDALLALTCAACGGDLSVDNPRCPPLARGPVDYAKESQPSALEATTETACRALLVAAHEVLSEVDIPFMLAHPSEELCERVRRNRLIALVVAIDAIQEGKG